MHGEVLAVLRLARIGVLHSVEFGGLESRAGGLFVFASFSVREALENSHFLCDKGVVTAGPDLVDGQKAALRLV